MCMSSVKYPCVLDEAERLPPRFHAPSRGAPDNIRSQIAGYLEPPYARLDPLPKPLLPQLQPGAPQHHSIDDLDSASEYDSGGGHKRTRTPWKIKQKVTDQLKPFDGDVKAFKHWVCTMTDHIAEDWPAWRSILEDTENAGLGLPKNLKPNTKIKGHTLWRLSQHLWSFISR